MLAVVQPMTPTSTSPTPPTMSTPGSGPSHSSSSGSTLPRRTSATTTVNYRPPVPSRAGASSGSVHFQHQLPPSRAPSYHVNGHASSSTSSASSSTTTAAPTPQAPLPPRAATPPPAPPPDSHSQPPAPPQPTIDISSYSSTDLLKLLASLLTQIAATNDSLSTSHSSNPTSPLHAAPSAQIHSPIWSTLTSASRTALSTPASTLTFHARNIPTISLESYFLRILKYCPTTNHVFLSLLVYFDRMAKLSLESTGRAFVIDSYNVHRLVIAGVTVASKFFSDVFYTNSRYAKVGGLPLPELNQLELQFLLLNDFRLVIKGDEMQRYAEQLILFSKSSGAGKEKEIPRDGHSAEAGTN
ncbi:cyclin-domain-containing protein [Ephemerocybe angulata]|uniref:Cyclin-domain-containing protein n=1 Tax=Ephemerocybe angulata TaxID=980116 RepID=A0A8H6IDN5_9AGAR|nr:cyclin-domain-containing protein [Tulosesus angulatus]